jgi:hypothetical protein
MSKQQFVNNFEAAFTAAVLANPVTGTPATELGYGVLQIDLSAGAILGTLAAGEYMKLTLFKRASGVQSDFEIVKVLGINEAGYSSGSETRIRVERAQEGTSAKAYAIGDFISGRWTAAAAENVLYQDTNLAGLADQAVARANLGLGTGAVANTGTGAGNVILGNDARLTDARPPNGAAGGVLAGTYPNPGFAASMATTVDLSAAIATREPNVTAGSPSQYWRGDKTWRDFATDVRTAVLTGLSTASALAVTAADSVLAAIGKLQAQVSARLPLSGGVLTGDLTVPSLNGGALGGLRNRVINGGFDVWDYSTSDTYSGSAWRFGAANRWRYYSVAGASGSATVSRQSFTPGQTDVPGNPTYFLRWNQTVVGTTGAVYLAHPIEGVMTLAGAAAAAGLYLRAAAPVSVTIQAIQDFGAGGSAAVSTSLGTAAVTTSWQFFPFTATLPSVVGKTIGSNDHLLLALSTSALSTFVIDVAQVQLEPGTVATPFVPRPTAIEELLCRRYLPVTECAYLKGQAYASNAAYFDADFGVPARVPPNGILLASAPSSYAVTTITFANVATTDAAIGFGVAGRGGASFTVVFPTSVWASNETVSSFRLTGTKILWTGAEL